LPWLLLLGFPTQVFPTQVFPTQDYKETYRAKTKCVGEPDQQDYDQPQGPALAAVWKWHGNVPKARYRAPFHRAGARQVRPGLGQAREYNLAFLFTPRKPIAMGGKQFAMADRCSGECCDCHQLS
jgi:hypothetical protein